MNISCFNTKTSDKLFVVKYLVALKCNHEEEYDFKVQFPGQYILSLIKLDRSCTSLLPGDSFLMCQDIFRLANVNGIKRTIFKDMLECSPSYTKYKFNYIK